MQYRGRRKGGRYTSRTGAQGPIRPVECRHTVYLPAGKYRGTPILAISPAIAPLPSHWVAKISGLAVATQFIGGPFGVITAVKEVPESLDLAERIPTAVQTATYCGSTYCKYPMYNVAPKRGLT